MPQPNDDINKRMFLAEMLNDASIDSVVSTDAELRVTSWNTMCEALSGKPRASVLGKHIGEVFPELAESKALTAALNNALTGLKSFVSMQEGSFSGEYVETHVIPLKDVLEQVVGVLIIRHDVAHRQKAELELKRLNLALSRKAKELEASNAELVSFGRVTSHDLKEPLRKINIFTTMLLQREEGRFSEEGTSLFRRIQKSAKRAEALTDDIFAFANIHRVTELLSDVNLNVTLSVTRQNLHLEIVDCNAGIDAEPLPVIKGYRKLLHHLFHNLVHNSLKFCQAGQSPHIIIRTGVGAQNGHSQHNEPNGGRYRWISFKDNGIGFEPEYNERIFGLFQKLHQPEQYPGNGIGLSLCRKIMEIHGGSITAESRAEGGSVFTCWFPEPVDLP